MNSSLFQDPQTLGFVSFFFLSFFWGGEAASSYNIVCLRVDISADYVAIPLFTHNGTGLKNKRDPNEYISIFDHRSGKAGMPLSNHGALRTEYLDPDIRPYDPLSTAHLTYPCPRKYSLMVAYEGNLDRHSTDLLVSLCHHYFPYPPR